MESVPRLPPISAPQPGSDANQREAVNTTQAETKHQVGTVGAFTGSTESERTKEWSVWGIDVLSSLTVTDGVCIGRDYECLTSHTLVEM